MTGYVAMPLGDDNLAAAVAISPTSVGMIFAGTAFDYESGNGTSPTNSIVLHQKKRIFFKEVYLAFWHQKTINSEKFIN